MSSPLTNIPPTAIHLCVDMQNIFAPGGPWSTPWMGNVAPIVEEIAGRFAEHTVFTRFITPAKPGDMPGRWRVYYEKWHGTTREQINPELLELLLNLRRFVPPAQLIDKTRFSAFANTPLHSHLMSRNGRYGHRHRIGNGRLRSFNGALSRRLRLSRDSST